MSVERAKREVEVDVIRCDRDGCDGSVAPNHEPMKGWIAIVSMEAAQRGGFQVRPGNPLISKYVCPDCAKVVAASLRTSATLSRDPEAPSGPERYERRCVACGMTFEMCLGTEVDCCERCDHPVWVRP